MSLLRGVSVPDRQVQTFVTGTPAAEAYGA